MTLDLPTSADVLIVGAGSAGCVLAEKLSRNPARTVLVVERGAGWPDDADRDVRCLPIGSGARAAVHHQEDSGLGVVRGNTLGGSSVINGGYFLRWHPEDFDDWPDDWTAGAIAAAYDELDGSGGMMSVADIPDAELGDAAAAFETYWSSRVSVREPGARWPIVGLNRVRGNRIGSLRMTAAEAYLRPALSRPNLSVVTGARVDVLRVRGGRTVTGVCVGSAEIVAGEVIVCAGTLGTAGILLRSDLDVLAGRDTLPIAEHRSLAVTYRRRLPADAGPLLPSVLHTADGLEIRCYRDDFASFVPGVVPSGVKIGIAAMRAGTGRVRADGESVRLAFDPVAAPTADDLRACADAIVEMLAGPEFAEVAEPGSVQVASEFGASQHAWGSMPMGDRVDRLGGVVGVDGLRIVDGSILPNGGRSGPHATIMMMAGRVGALLG